VIAAVSDQFDRPSKHLPSPSLEYWYYAQVFYSIMGSAFGLSIDLLGVAMLAALVGLCVIRMGRYSAAMLRPVALPLACGMSFIAVQTLVHGESLRSGDYVRSFVPWMMGLVIVQYLSLRRGFLHRAAIAVLLIGLTTLPYMKSFHNDQSRTSLEGIIAIANPNDLGAWFGFCVVYFAVLGMETRRNWIRVISCLVAVGSLVVVSLTVSRAPLIAAALSVVIAFRRVLKRGFFPLLSLIVLTWIAFGLGWFDRGAELYAQRGLEETGRFLVWPAAFDRFLQSPLVGVGADNVNTSIAGGRPITPHNSFIFLAVASGVVPLMFFIAYWVRLLIEVLEVNADSHEDAPFLIPLLPYCFLIAFNLNMVFTVQWMMATLAAVSGAEVIRRARRAAVERVDGRHRSGNRGLHGLPARGRA
jgi:O-antigen ligase